MRQILPPYWRSVPPATLQGRAVTSPILPAAHSLYRFLNRVTRGDALRVLKSLPAGSVDCVVTRPPLWQQPGSGGSGRLGLEPTLEEYLEALLSVFSKARRVLKPAGACWVAMADTYFGDSPACARREGEGGDGMTRPGRAVRGRLELRRLCLTQLPARFSLAMTRLGWVLRSEVSLRRPEVRPGNDDRLPQDAERLFFFVRGRPYYFDRRPLTPAGGPGEFPFPDGAILAGCPEGGVVLDPFAESGEVCAAARRLGRRFVAVAAPAPATGARQSRPAFSDAA
jgi:DNA modification methylase